MRRREFIALAGAAAWPLAAGAQLSHQVRRIGVLITLAEEDPEARAWIGAFEQGLEALGWSPGRNLRIEYRWAAADAQRLGAGAAELVGMAPDALFASVTPALTALHRETRALPIVFVQVSDPVKLGFVASLARPGGNVTGFANFEHPIVGKWLELLRDVAPGRNRVAIILDPDTRSQIAYREAIEAAAPAFGMELTRVEVRNAAEIERGIEAFAQQPNGVLVVAPSPITLVNRDFIIALAARHRVPAIYPYRFFAQGGGLISYGIDLPALYRQAASYVDRILKGENPADLPIQQPTKFELAINLRTASTLGINIPQNLLARADEVIE